MSEDFELSNEEVLKIARVLQSILEARGINTDNLEEDFVHDHEIHVMVMGIECYLGFVKNLCTRNLIDKI